MNRTIIPIAALLLVISGVLIPAAAKSCLPAPLTPGSYEVVCDTFKSPGWEETFYLFHPGPDTVAPLILLCPAFSVEGPHDYHELIHHLAGRGNHVLYVPARKISLTRNKVRKYDLGVGGVVAAVGRRMGIDTTRIVVAGHGFGGGAVPALTRALRIRGWGEEGVLMYIMSPWYLYSIDERAMAAFPDKVNMVVQTFADDNLNDPKIAADIYSLVGIPQQRKLYLATDGISTENCRIRADFATPFGDRSVLDEWNQLDLQAICLPLDAAVRWTFSGDTVPFARAVARDIAPDPKTPAYSKSVLAVIDTPAAHLPRGIWINLWNSPRNPRIETSVIKKARKTYFRGKAKKVAQITRHVAKTARAKVTDNEEPGDDVWSPIDTGFGADGSFAIIEERFAQPRGNGDTVSVFFPESTAAAPPVIFFLHGYNNGKTAYFSQMIDHIASNGYALVFAPYPTFPAVDDEATVMEKYIIAYEGFDAAVRRFAGRLDTNRIGIFGQSFGAGAVPWVAKKLITERGMGKDGAFMFVSAPWYMYGVTDADLAAIPASVKLLVTVYDDDVFNDHQMAVDFFGKVALPPSEKCYVTMYSDTLDSIVLSANHFVPYGSRSVYGVIDNLDYYGIFRRFDALAAYTFTGDSIAKAVALGSGLKEQCFMGEWPDGTPVRPATVAAVPKALHPSLRYMFSWDNRLNPRRGALKVPFRDRRADRMKD